MKRLFKLVASIAVSLALCWWAFRNTNWSEMWESLRTAEYLWLIPYFALLSAVHLSRTIRWGFLLSGMEKVPFKKLNEAAAIGFMMLLVLPFRLGEFARPYLIANRSGIRKSAAMTTVVLERIVDGLFVATLLRVLLFFVPTDSPGIRHVQWGSTLMFAVFGGGLAFLLFALWQQQLAVDLVRKTAGRVAPKVADKAAEIVDAFVGGMRRLPDGKRIAGFFIATVIYWSLNGIGMTMMARAFGMDLSAFNGFVILSVLIVFLMIPAAPGMIGTFQAGTIMGLGLFVPATVVNSQGLAYANVVWLAQTVQTIVFGLIFMSTSQMSFSEITHKLGEQAKGGVEPPAAIGTGDGAAAEEAADAPARAHSG